MTRFEKKFDLSSLEPHIDVKSKMKKLDDVELTVEELLHPEIIKVSDLHWPLPNAYVPAYYEMRRVMHPKAVFKNGDNNDMHGLNNPHVFYTLEILCAMDQDNWLQAEEGVQELATHGNHDDKLMADLRGAREAGLNIFPGIRQKHPKRRDTVHIHGHQMDSETMVVVPARMAASKYDELVSKGADGASGAKIGIKFILDGLPYEEAFRAASRYYDAHLDMGHVHLVKAQRFKEGERDGRKARYDLVKRNGIRFVLTLHQTGALQILFKRKVIPAFERAIESSKDIDLHGKHDYRSIFIRVARQMLPVLESDPDITLLNGLTYDKLKPRVISEEQMRGATIRSTHKILVAPEIVRVNVYGCWIDNRKTFGATYANGQTWHMDWGKVREAIREEMDLPEEPLSGNDLIAQHFERYPGLHPNTIKQWTFFMRNAGYLPDEETRKLAQFPTPEELAVVQMSGDGKISIKTPDGSYIQRAQMPRGEEIIPPSKILALIDSLDLRAAADLERRIQESPQLAAMFDPQRQIRVNRALEVV